MPPKKASAKRDVIIAGNWKMYKTIEEATHFVATLAPLIVDCQAKVYLAVPFTAIYPVSSEVKEKALPLHIGAQNMHDATDGAFTGEIAARMLKEAGAEFVILGHSERRHLFNETNDFINKKVKKALVEGLQPILCVGETEKERHEGKTEDVLRHQLEESLKGISKEDLSKIILAYEPVWAIGTGKVATPDDAENAHLFCKEVLKEGWGAIASKKVPILYGGSVKAQNAKNLLNESAVDGLLVGGASLDPKEFSRIAKTPKE